MSVAGRTELTAPRPAQGICQGIEQIGQNLPDSTADQFAQVVVAALLLDLGDVAQVFLAIFGHGGGLLCSSSNRDNRT